LPLYRCNPVDIGSSSMMRWNTGLILFEISCIMFSSWLARWVVALLLLPPLPTGEQWRTAPAPPDAADWWLQRGRTAQPADVDPKTADTAQAAAPLSATPLLHHLRHYPWRLQGTPRTPTRAAAICCVTTSPRVTCAVRAALRSAARVCRQRVGGGRPDGR